MKADDLYNALAGSAWKLAAQSTLDADDIRQELYLKCMEVAEGRSTYSPLVGGVHEYIMGWLWKYILRWQKMPYLEELFENVNEENEETEEIVRYFPELQSPSIEDELMRREEMYAEHQRDIKEIRRMREQMKDETTLAILIKTGHWTIREAAKHCGTSYASMQRYMQLQRFMNHPAE